MGALSEIRSTLSAGILDLLLRTNGGGTLLGTVAPALIAGVAAGRGKRSRAFVSPLEANHPFTRFLKRLNGEISPRCRRKLLSNLVVRSWLANRPARRRFFGREGFYPPYAVSIAPTSRCNLACGHCSSSGQNGGEIDPGLLRTLLTEARDDMGVHFFIVTGGEPFMYPHLLDVMEEFGDCYFQVFTNGTLLGDDTVASLARLGNALIMLSLEGFEQSTDARRRGGVFRSAVEAMRRLHEAGLPYGFSVMTTRHNTDTVTGEAFADWAIARGCLLGYYFNYMPVGADPDMSLLPTPAQRDRSRRNVYRLRSRKPIFLVDVHNDGPVTGGCTGAGRHYIHILSSGDVVPCTYCNFSPANIKNSTLTEALASPYLEAFRRAIPFEGNTLRCCILLDRPRFFFRTLELFRPKPCIPGEEEELRRHEEELIDYARRVKTIYDEAWIENDWESIIAGRRWSIDGD